MDAIGSRFRARELAHHLWHELQTAGGRRLSLTSGSHVAMLAVELQNVLFNGDEQQAPNQVVRLRPGRYLIFDGSAGARHVRAQLGFVEGGLDVDLGDPLADAQAAIARLRAIPV